MKTASILAAVAITLTKAHARVGETAQEIETRYGKPTGETKRWGGDPRREYTYRGYRVLVSFHKDVCRAESYRKIPPSPFLESEVTALLREHAAGSKWERMPIPANARPGALVLYHTPDNRFAIHDTVRHTLQFSKEVFAVETTVR